MAVAHYTLLVEYTVQQLWRTWSRICWVPWKIQNFLSNVGIISFPRTPLCGAVYLLHQWTSKL